MNNDNAGAFEFFANVYLDENEEYVTGDGSPEVFTTKEAAWSNAASIIHGWKTSWGQQWEYIATVSNLKEDVSNASQIQEAVDIMISAEEQGFDVDSMTLDEILELPDQDNWKPVPCHKDFQSFHDRREEGR